jgi:hypothetical protein
MKNTRWLHPRGFQHVSPDIGCSRIVAATSGRLRNPRKIALAAARNVAYTDIAGSL